MQERLETQIQLKQQKLIQKLRKKCYKQRYSKHKKTYAGMPRNTDTAKTTKSMQERL